MLFAETQVRMNPEDFNEAMQLRCGFFRRGFHTCTCGFPLHRSTQRECTAHALTCPDNTYNYKGRHEEIVAEIRRTCERWAFHTIHEPHFFYSEVDERRPDVVVCTSRKSPVIDVTVVTNIAMSHAAQSDPAAVAAKEKTDKHASYIDVSPQYKFYPIAVETSGNVHETFDQFVQELSHSLSFNQVKQFRREMAFTLAVALQRGNARILQHYYARLMRIQTFGSQAWH